MDIRQPHSSMLKRSWVAVQNNLCFKQPPAEPIERNICMTLPASKQEARQLVKEAEQKIQAGDNIGAAICYAKASYGFEHIPRCDPEAGCRLLKWAGDLFLLEGELDKALKYYESAEEMANQWYKKTGLEGFRLRASTYHKRAQHVRSLMALDISNESSG